MNGLAPSNRRVRADEPHTPSPSPSVEAPPALKPPSRILSALRTAVGVVLVAAVAAGVAWTARRHVMTSPRFSVASIDVTGNEQRSRDALVSEAGLALGRNIFTVDLDAARAKLRADPWIADAALARRLPGEILVQVTERRAAALVALGEVYLATAEGDPFKPIEPGDPVDLPVVTGVRPDDLSADREGAVRTIRRAIDLAFEYDQGPLSRRAPLEEVHVSPDGTFALVVGTDATRVLLGPPPFRRKLEQAARVFAELDKRSSRADTIMLDNDTRPERVVVRVR
jgi:cell division protein FtsQ